MTPAKIADVFPKHTPDTFKIKIIKNQERLTINFPSVAFKGRRFDVIFDKDTNFLLVCEVPDDKTKGNKVGENIVGDLSYYKLIFAAEKWAKKMPNMKTELIEVLWDKQNKSFLVDLSKYVPAKKEVMVPKVLVTKSDINPISRDKAVSCVQYLNRFIEAEKDYKFEIVNGKLRIKREDIIE